MSRTFEKNDSYRNLKKRSDIRKCNQGVWKVNCLYDFDSYTGNAAIDSTRVTKLSYQGLTLTIDDGLSSYLATVGAAQEFYTEAQWRCTK